MVFRHKEITPVLGLSLDDIKVIKTLVKDIVHDYADLGVMNEAHTMQVLAHSLKQFGGQGIALGSILAGRLIQAKEQAREKFEDFDMDKMADIFLPTTA